jgi:hypothetical protein
VPVPFRTRHYARREPTPVAQLTREQTAGRIYQLREALDTLVNQCCFDGGEAYSCYGAMKVTLIALEGQLREMDRQRPAQPFAAAVTVPAAEQRLARAQDALDVELAQQRGGTR